MKKYIIENDKIKLEINSHGGSLTSIFDKELNQEILYQPLDNSWSGQDVVIFPFVGRLKDKRYFVNSKEYHMESHGLIRYDELSLYKSEATKLTLRYRANAQTMMKYPFMFDFYITYEVLDKGYEVSYQVINMDNKEMYFGLGGHPAFLCGGISSQKGFSYENTYLTFDGYLFNRYELDSDGCFIYGKVPYKQPDKLVISKELINKYKTLIFDSSMLSSVTLHTNEYCIKMELEKCPIFALWSDDLYGNYLCLEPWWSLPDFNNPKLELKDKPTINKLAPFSEFTRGYKVFITRV